MIANLEKLHVCGDIGELVFDTGEKVIHAKYVGGVSEIKSDCEITPEDRILVSDILYNKALRFGCDESRLLGIGGVRVFGDGQEIQKAVCVDMTRMVIDRHDDRHDEPLVMASGESICKLTDEYSHIKMVSECGRFCVEKGNLITKSVDEVLSMNDELKDRVNANLKDMKSKVI